MLNGQKLFSRQWVIRVGLLAPEPIKAAHAKRLASRATLTTTVEDLCRRALIRYRVTGGFQPLVKIGPFGGHFRWDSRRSQPVFFIESAETAPEDPEQSVRALEILAHAFHDYAARECVRGLFVGPDKLLES